MKSNFKTYGFIIPSWAMSALINGDYSGLSTEDVEKINKFCKDTYNDIGSANFCLGDIEGKDNLGFRPSNDIDNLGDNCYRLYVAVCIK